MSAEHYGCTSVGCLISGATALEPQENYSLLPAGSGKLAEDSYIVSLYL